MKKLLIILSITLFFLACIPEIKDLDPDKKESKEISEIIYKNV